MKQYHLNDRHEVDGDLGVLIAALQDGTREWREELESPSVEAIVWQPYPNGPSIGAEILHIASCEWYWLGNFVQGEPDPVDDPAIQYDNTLDQYIPHWPTPPAQPIDWYLDILASRRAKSIEMIRQHGRPEAVYARQDCEVTYAWIVAHLVQHDSYHGGQAVMLNEMYKKMRPAAIDATG
jgi:uncharacterized damage-inducible protein DinB